MSLPPPSLLPLALNDQSDLNSLLAYYRSRIESFEDERREWLQKMEEIREKQDLKHKTEWELKKRREEISELQRTLSEAKLIIFDERQKSLKLTRDNDLMKIREVEDRRKIGELLAMTDSVEEEVNLFKDLRPESNTKYIRSDLNLTMNKENRDRNGRLGANYQTRSKNVVKTIYLPNEQMNLLAIENENLKKQLNDQTILSNRQIEALKSELELIREEGSMRANVDRQAIEDLEDRLKKSETSLINVTKDFFGLRIKSQEAERRAQEENEVLRLKNVVLGNKLAFQTRQMEVDNKVTRELAEKKAVEYTDKFRNQIRTKEESLQLIKDQYGKIQQIYLERVKELEENLSKLAEKYYRLEKRRNLEVQGFKADIKRLQGELNRREMEEKYSFDLEKIDQDKKEEEPIEIVEREKVKDDSVNIEELEAIKTQLEDLEKKLDQTKKKR